MVDEFEPTRRKRKGITPTGSTARRILSAEAVSTWELFRDLWGSVNPRSLTFSRMDEPVFACEEWVAWDHTSALKFTWSGGSITVEAALEGNEIAINGPDPGIGLTGEDCGKIFDEFFRVRGGDRAEAIGLGWDCRSRRTSLSFAAAGSGPGARGRGVSSPSQARGKLEINIES